MRLHIKIRYVEYAEPQWEWELLDLDTGRVIEFGEADTFAKAEAETNEVLAAYEKEITR